MSNSLLRTDKEIAEIYTRHSKTVYRVCFAYMKNPADTEDAVQDTFFQLIKSGPAFESEEHEKAWLIRTASSDTTENELWMKYPEIMKALSPYMFCKKHGCYCLYSIRSKWQRLLYRRSSPGIYSKTHIPSEARRTTGDIPKTVGT